MRGNPRSLAVAALIACAAALIPASPAIAAGTWTWPVRGPVVRGFDPPASPYGAGHRGIDVAAAAGTVVVAPAAGVVSFAGRVAGELFVSIDHGAGLVSTSSYLSASLVAKGDPVAAGQPVALSGTGHPGATAAHVHLGVRLGGVYVDPLDYLGPVSLAGILWLAPLVADPPSAAPARSAGRAPSARLAGPPPLARVSSMALPGGRLPTLPPIAPARGRPVPP